MALLMVTKGLPQTQPPYPDSTLSSGRKDPLFWVSLRNPSQKPWIGLLYVPVPKLITGRGGRLPILTGVSLDSPWGRILSWERFSPGAGAAALKHKPHIERRIPEHTRFLLGTGSRGVDVE